jgi:hypothetical protein
LQPAELLRGGLDRRSTGVLHGFPQGPDRPGRRAPLAIPSRPAARARRGNRSDARPTDRRPRRASRRSVGLRGAGGQRPRCATGRLVASARFARRRLAYRGSIQHVQLRRTA